MEVVPASVFLVAPVMVTVGGVSVGVYPLPIPERLATRANPCATPTVRLPVPVVAPEKATLRVPSALMDDVPVSVPASGPVMVTAGAGSPAVYPEPMPVRLLTPRTPVATFMVTLLVSVGFPEMVTLRVPSELTEEVPERVPAFGEVKVTVGGVSVVLYPVPMELKLVGTRMIPLAMVAVRFALPVGLPENVTSRVPSALTVAVPARVPASVPVMTTFGAVSVGS